MQALTVVIRLLMVQPLQVVEVEQEVVEMVALVVAEELLQVVLELQVKAMMVGQVLAQTHLEVEVEEAKAVLVPQVLHLVMAEQVQILFQHTQAAQEAILVAAEAAVNIILVITELQVPVAEA